MKQVVLSGVLLALAVSAHAAEYGVAAGRDFQQFSRTPEGIIPGFTLDYLHHDHQGSAGGLGLMMGVSLGPVSLGGGVKAMAIDTDAGSATAALPGARASLALGHGLSVYASAFQAPSALASGSVGKVIDRSAGVQWQPVGPLTLTAGYRQFEIERQDASRNRTLADGAYLGVGLSF
ncbi:YfaZ family outer membrane protein [Paludibacterium sp. THUN1379]|uniref:YfaZ family outer membrane protein n=1 Tax=Paludibacterium sp. THUN1379 TaxID=3112107 RepID=UPI0030936E42|nr:YfaZ family outer membrane protein [Paludibacterium sp. THUN1379]